ncbi:alpha/beta hydrolase [Mucilaginibacter sp. HMF5004]|uniref:alpha/beta fold hydrolase n=1 Tax=Mucilaginibacter rivuli TaxID=2857527 RepID=UPI001C606CA6|nr:alpha/beta hydrolase [Mucilaginibacter rivuli]MBW4891280.1 alpha/beta hydrolase [Mucilaginibacter rivuli]
MKPTLQSKNNITIGGNLNAATTLVFAHGFGTDQTAWDTVKQAFKDDYKLVLYDNVGAGNADPKAYSPIKYNTLNTYADDMLAIAADLELNNAVVIAHSVSSMVSLLASNKAPQYFSKTLFIGASPRYLNDETQSYIGGFTQPVLDGMYETMTTNYYAWVSGFSAAAMANPDKPELGESFARSLGAIRPDIALSVAKVIFESDVRKELAKHQKPTMLLQTKHDIAVPSDVAHYLNTNITNSDLKFIDAEGHFPHISAPGQVIEAIKAFI